MDVFFFEDDKLLGKYIGIWNKVSNRNKKNLYYKPVYNKALLILIDVFY